MLSLTDYLNEARKSTKKDIPIPLDCSDMSIEQIANSIATNVNPNKDNGNMKNEQFYAGICKNVEDNMARHGNNSYAALVDCGTRERAGELEKTLGDLGFDVGERANNGGDKDTTIVYVIKKDRNFKR